MSISHIRSKIDFIAALNPSAWDAVHPHTPFAFSNAHVDLLVADVVKQASVSLADKSLSKSALELSKKMAAEASSSVVHSWEPGDELCPPWLGPIHPPVPPVAGPQPEPWRTISSADQIELAVVLTHLSALTTNAEFNSSLKGLATSVVRGAAGKLTEDFEQCGTKPRSPFPPRHH